MTLDYFLNRIDLEKEDIEKIEGTRTDVIIFAKTYAERFFENKESFPHLLKKMRKTCPDVSPYMADLILVISAFIKLKEKYDRENIPKEIYWDTALDIKYKLEECKSFKGQVGTFDAQWFEGFLNLTRFALGRLQFDIIKSGENIKTAKGKIKKGDYILSCHIPSGKKLLYDDVLLSYKKAYEFSKGKFDSPLPIICISWLLYPEYRDIFKNCPNINRFIKDFEIYKTVNQKEFEDSWRVFSVKKIKSIDELPDKTIMQRNFIEYIKTKNKYGYAFGVIFFDGEKII